MPKYFPVDSLKASEVLRRQNFHASSTRPGDTVDAARARAGVSAIFGPGTNVLDAMRSIFDLLEGSVAMID